MLRLGKAKCTVVWLLSLVMVLGLLAPMPILAGGQNRGELSAAMAQAVTWLGSNHNPPEYWEALSALRGAGEDLNQAPWKSNQSWRATDPGFAPDNRGNEHIHYIFKLMALGENPARVWEGRNLFAELADQQDQGNGSLGRQLGRHIWGLVALELGQKLDVDTSSWDETGRQAAINYLLRQQNSSGSFGPFSQLDHTGWTLVALSPYRGDPSVDEAIERSLEFLQARQNSNAGFDPPSGPWGEEAENSNSNAAVLSGLVAVEEDVLDPQGEWARDGNTVLDALLAFQQEDGGFWQTEEQQGNRLMATTQALAALADLKQGGSFRHQLGVVSDSVTFSVEKEVLGQGPVVESSRVALDPGDTAYSVLARVAEEKSIPIDRGGSGSTLYVRGINGLKEFDHGPLSGWKYAVNGVFPNRGSDDYVLEGGDTLRWMYTRDGGEDLLRFLNGPGASSHGGNDRLLSQLQERARQAGSWIQNYSDFAEADGFLDWSAFALARAGQGEPRGYRQVLTDHVRENQGRLRLVTDYSRVIIALTALGANPSEVAGYNLVKKMYNHGGMTNQGTNGPVFALIALDTREHQVPDGAAWDRPRLINWILDQQNEDGGFPLHRGGEGAVSEVDMTAMTLQALASYRSQDRVKAAVDRGLQWLESEQLESGGFKAQGEENCESVAQVIIALAALGIDPGEQRFAPQGKSLWDNLASFGRADGGFAHGVGDEDSSAIATQQALMAISAYQRGMKGQNSLYDLTEAGVPDGDKAPSEGVTMFIDNTTYWLDGAEKEMAFAPFIEDGRTFVPVRFVAEEFGLEADWGPREGMTQWVTLRGEGMDIRINIGDTSITVVENGQERTVESDAMAQIRQGTTVLPLRAVGEMLDARFDWGPRHTSTRWVNFRL